MRRSPSIPLVRGFIFLSLVLLALVEFFWLRNEYRTRYRAMGDQLTQVMYSAMRDVEDSLIFTRIVSPAERASIDSGGVITLAVKLQGMDTLRMSKEIVEVRGGPSSGRSRHPLRGIFLEQLRKDSAACDSLPDIGSIVLRHIRASDSTGEAAAYQMITWREGDTVLDLASSRPGWDFLAGHRMVLANTDHRADLLRGMAPIIGFAVVVWLMIAAAFWYMLRSLRRQLALNALRDEFVGNITHELKTPITTVGVALETLSRSGEVSGDAGKSYLDISRNELARLSRLVERILHANASEMNLEPVDMRSVTEDVLHSMQVQFDGRQARVHLETQGDGFAIQGDRTHLSGVLYNLLDNALKYSPGTPDIDVRVVRDNGSVRLEVTDHGIGIDPEYHRRIFEKLFRVPAGNRHDVKGHGLGLSYVADVVRKLHGQVDVQSAPGQGSTFTLTFPASHEN